METSPKTLRAPLASRITTLWVGFAGLLLLLGFSAFDAAQSIQSMGAASATVRSQSRARDDLLDRLRSQLDQSGIVARDYLLEPDAQRADRIKHEMEQTQKRSEETLAAYENLLPDEEKAAFSALNADVQAYWRSLSPILEWSAAERKDKGDDYLQDEVLPRRGQAVELAQQISNLNSRELDAAETQLRKVSEEFRQRVILVSAVALVIGLVLAAVSIRRLKRLEFEAELRYQEAEGARKELKRLADRLVVTQEEERRSISRELHDEVGQSMSAMLMDLGSVESALTPGSAHRQRLTTARELAESSVRAIRNIALLLRPSMLDDLGLVPALKWQAREVSRRTGLKVKMVADEVSEDLPESYRTCVYRVVQEALHNCAQHARATRVRVAVRQNRGELSVSIEDDGVGFHAGQEKGLGLVGMEERVRMLGGTLKIESQAAGGTSLSILLPLPEERPSVMEQNA